MNMLRLAALLTLLVAPRLALGAAQTLSSPSKTINCTDCPCQQAAPDDHGSGSGN